MTQIAVGSEEGVGEIRRRLDGEFRLLKKEGIDVSVRETSRGGVPFLDLSVRNYPERGSAQDVLRLFKHYLAVALSDVIVNGWEASLVRKILNENYRGFDRREQEIILSNVGHDLDGGGLSGARFYRLSRKGKVLQRLLDYLDGSDELVLEGFVRFRLKDYREELEDAVDRAVDEFLLEKEYDEFIRMLRYFVATREPRIGSVHVIFADDGVFKVFADDGRKVREELLDGSADGPDQNFAPEDLLVGTLVALAPAGVNIHPAGAKDCDRLIATIRDVFGERVTVCKGCPLCRRPPE